MCQSPYFAFKGEIQKGCLHDAMASGRQVGWFVDLWQASPNQFLRWNEKSGEAVSECENKMVYQVERQVKLTCWNCRGLTDSVPYLNSRFQVGW